MFNTRFDYEFIREKNSPGWKIHWLILLDGRSIIVNNELIEDQNAALFRLGFTVQEIAAAINHTGYTTREVDWYSSQPDRYQLVGGQYVQVQGWAEQYVAQKLADAKAEKQKELQASKCKLRDAGIFVDGVLWDTDANAQTMYTQFMVALVLDPSYVIADWKASQGVFAEMDVVTFTQIRAAWTELCSRLTSRQKAKETEIQTLTSVEDVELYDCSTGWS